ncbi:MAG TPA: DUF6491 family protein [Woeseiaceae bacterium]|nr:DUF6491 family protein [Woeseiaceae bacterium]
MYRSKLMLMTLCAGLTAAGISAAQEAGGEDTQSRDMNAKHCVRVQSIDQIDIVDSDTLVFRMRGDEVYRNELPYNCPGLQQGDTLMYRTTLGQVCDLDIVTVLEDWGFGFAPGASCGLGMFDPITEQIADELLQAKR